jgi:hypothetical protein
MFACIKEGLVTLATIIADQSSVTGGISRPLPVAD